MDPLGAVSAHPRADPDGIDTMSRTKKGSKGPGNEFWTARPGNKQGSSPGKIQKKWTHKAERRLAKPGLTGHVVRRFGKPDEDTNP
jgi:hypothetical protein